MSVTYNAVYCKINLFCTINFDVSVQRELADVDLIPLILASNAFFSHN